MSPEHDNLSAARGIIVACLFSLALWACVIALGVWLA